MKSRQAESLVGNGSARWARTPRLPHAVSKMAPASTGKNADGRPGRPPQAEGLPHKLVASGRGAGRGGGQIDGAERSQRTVVRLQVAADVLEVSAGIVVHEFGVAVI